MEEEAVKHYLKAFANSWGEDTPIGQVRFAVLDCEATGTDPRRDQLVTIGGVAVEQQSIIVQDGYETLVKVPYNTASVFIHGITREAAQAGLDEADAILGFIEWVGDGVIVGHHIGFDVALLNRASERHFGLSLQNRVLDTMELALHLRDDGALRPAEEIRDFSLDALCTLFGVVPHDRHTAQGDAFLTAQVFIKLLKMAKRTGRERLGLLLEPYAPEGAE